MRDLKGKVFNRLTVIEFSHKYRKPSGGLVYLWKCQCSCGNIATIELYSLISESTKSCGCLHIERTKEANTNNKGRVPYRSAPGVSGFNILYKNYKSSAKRRGLEFSLNKEVFKKLTKENCFNCGKEPSQIRTKPLEEYRTLEGIERAKYIYNGIDRIDNNKGYIIDNVVPCCKTCNIAKLQNTQEEFDNWIKKVYKHKILTKQISGE